MHDPIRLHQWLDAGAPCYPKGEAEARRIWTAITKREHLESRGLVVIGEPPIDPLDELIPDLEPAA